MITTSHVSDAVQGMFGKVNIQIEDNHLLFGLEVDYFRAEVVIAVSEEEIEFSGHEPIQSLTIIMWFCDKDGLRMTVPKTCVFEALDICESIRDPDLWSSLLMFLDPTGDKYEFCISRKIDTCLYDLIQSGRRYIDGEFILTIRRLIREYEKLIPVIHNMHTGELHSSVSLPDLVDWEVSSLPKN